MASPAAAGQSRWSWRDTTVWVPYDDATCTQLNAALASGAGPVTLTLPFGSYRIDVAANTQTNLKTGYIRRIRCDGVGGAASSSTLPSAIFGIWEYKDGSKWLPYDVGTSALLSAAVASGASSVPISIAGKPYTVNITRMQQRNDTTGYTRPIRHVPGVAPSAPHPASSMCPTMPPAAPVSGGGAGGAGLASPSVAVPAGDVPVHEVISVRGSEGAEPSLPVDVASLTSWASVPLTCPSLSGEECSICMDTLVNGEPLNSVVRLGTCKHTFHTDCAASAFQHSSKCPNCGHLYAPLVGTQPDGTMTIDVHPTGRIPLSGHEDVGTIVMHWTFPSGMQGPRHPCPGVKYSGTTRVGYLPDNNDGRCVVQLLKRCFRARLLLTVGTSVTTGAANQTVWNGVHVKTSTNGGETRFGYPDATYFTRVKSELAAKGITP